MGSLLVALGLALPLTVFALAGAQADFEGQWRASASSDASRSNSVTVLGREPNRQNSGAPSASQRGTVTAAQPVEPSLDNMRIINPMPDPQAYPDPFLGREELDRLFSTDQGQSAQILQAGLNRVYPPNTVAGSLVNYLIDRFDIAVEQNIPDPFYEPQILGTRARRHTGTVINISDLYDAHTPTVKDLRAFDLRPLSPTILPDGNIAMDRAVQLNVSLILGEGNVLRRSQVSLYHSGHDYDKLGIPFRFENFNTPEAAARALESLVRPDMTLFQLEQLMNQAGASRLQSTDRYNPLRALYRYAPNPGDHLTAVIMRRPIEWIVGFDLTQPGRIAIEVSGPYKDPETRRTARRFYHFNAD